MLLPVKKLNILTLTENKCKRFVVKSVKILPDVALVKVGNTAVQPSAGL
jgi:hypothetical protein